MTHPSARLAVDNWEQHWRDYAEAAEQNPAQIYRQRIARMLLQRYGCGDGSRVLDIGSGQGDMAQRLNKAFPKTQLAGVELSAIGVQIASRKVPTAQFLQRDLLDPDSDPGPLCDWAQYAVCAEVLEHLDEPDTFLRQVSKYLAPGCVLVVTVPGGPMSAFDRHIGHRKHFTPTALRQLLEGCGFQVERATTAGFPFFNVYRAVVILRGDRLITDVQSGGKGSGGLLATLVMGVFRGLFSWNILGTLLGWQTVAVARWPGLNE